MGLRNPWRMSFDSLTGELYAVDAGQNLREEINLIVKGGNYGWAVREGTVEGPAWAPGVSDRFEFIEPIAEYDHSVGNGISGALLYRADPESPLFGSFLFSDFFMGLVGNIKNFEAKASTINPLLWKPNIASFGVHPADGTVLMAATFEHEILRLKSNLRAESLPLPTLLSQTGAFENLTSLTPHVGIVPYDVNGPLWSDRAVKKRWFGTTDETKRFGFNMVSEWDCPPETFWIKQFDLELEVGNSESRRRVETRFLVRYEGGVYGLTYRWNDEQTDAELVPEEGAEEVFTISEVGQIRKQVWQYPGRTQCLTCHTKTSGFILGFNTLQLNRYAEADEEAGNQVHKLSQAGYLDIVLDEEATLPALARASDQQFSLAYRVKSYMAVNCAPCHRPEGSSRGFLDLRWKSLMSRSGLVNSLPSTSLKSHPDDRIIAPNSLLSSLNNQLLKLELLILNSSKTHAEENKFRHRSSAIMLKAHPTHRELLATASSPPAPARACRRPGLR